MPQTRLLVRCLTAAGLAAAVSASVIAPVHAANYGSTDGCTPGFWKNHTDQWLERNDPPLVIKTTTRLDALFPSLAGTAFGSQTMLDALNYKGGSGLDGATRILLRSAVAAWLNAAHESLAHPVRRSGSNGLKARVESALQSGSRASLLSLAEELDATNNLGCPL